MTEEERQQQHGAPFNRDVYDLERQLGRDIREFDARLSRFEATLASLLERIDDLVTKARFHPVELIAYGLAGGILLTVLAAVLGKVIVR